MPYDKYRYWKRGSLGALDIKSQVIKDIEQTNDSTEKLEIIDSYEVYVERNQQDELAEHFARLVLNDIIQPLLVEFAKSKMPGSMPICRPRVATIET